MATILQRLKDQLKEYDIDPSGIQTISQALKRIPSPLSVDAGINQKVTGNTISECLDNIQVRPKEVPEEVPEEDVPNPDDETIK